MSVCLDFAPAGCFLDLRGIQPSVVLGLSIREVEALRVLYGNREAALGECCHATISIDEREALVLKGATGWILHAGYGMNVGSLIIEGDAGPLTGVEMSGGSLEVMGNASVGLGSGMQGGILHLHGNAGNNCGAALPGTIQGMTGGIILIDGDVGERAGANMRRGLIVICGECGEYLGVNLLAGTILCFGAVIAGVGMGMKRGTIVANRITKILPGFRSAGEADPEWLRICLGWLRRLRVAYPPKWERRNPLRFTGDHLGFGKGEVLGYDFSE